MLDDLRKSASSYIEEEEELSAKSKTKNRVSGILGDTLLGLTAPQRFIIAFFVLIMTCACSAFALLIFEKVVPPFF